jgi:hypothetical protein
MEAASRFVPPIFARIRSTMSAFVIDPLLVELRHDSSNSCICSLSRFALHNSCSEAGFFLERVIDIFKGLFEHGIL